MAYLCPTSLNSIIAVDNKIINTPTLVLNYNTGVQNKIIKASSPGASIIDAIITKTITEPCTPYGLPITGIVKSVSESFMQIATSRPLTGQFWPRNVIIRP